MQCHIILDSPYLKIDIAITKFVTCLWYDLFLNTHND